MEVDEPESRRLRFLADGSRGRRIKSMYSESWKAHNSSSVAGSGSMVLGLGLFGGEVRCVFGEAVGADERVDS